MKKIFTLIWIVIALPTMVFGETSQPKKSQRIYISPKEIICSESGIYIKREKSFLCAKALAFDVRGLYVLQEWLYNPAQFKDKGKQAPRGGHNTNVRPSTENRHQEADARRAREQAAAQRRREEAQRRGRRK